MIGIITVTFFEGRYIASTSWPDGSTIAIAHSDGEEAMRRIQAVLDALKADFAQERRKDKNAASKEAIQKLLDQMKEISDLAYDTTNPPGPIPRLPGD